MTQVVSFPHHTMMAYINPAMQATFCQESMLPTIVLGQSASSSPVMSRRGSHNAGYSPSATHHHHHNHHDGNCGQKGHSPQNNHRKRPAVESDFRVKYKTELCRNWAETGTCEFNEHCAFAHGTEEIRPKTYLTKFYKTKLCKSFHEYGFCVYGERCQFLHHQKSFNPEVAAPKRHSVSGVPSSSSSSSGDDEGNNPPKVKEMQKPRRYSFSDAILEPDNYSNPFAENPSSSNRLKVFQVITSGSMSNQTDWNSR